MGSQIHSPLGASYSYIFYQLHLILAYQGLDHGKLQCSQYSCAPIGSRRSEAGIHPHSGTILNGVGITYLGLAPTECCEQLQITGLDSEEAELLTKLIDSAISQSEYEQQIRDSEKDVASKKSDSSAVKFVAPIGANQNGS
jgi:hypothetical protein